MEILDNYLINVKYYLPRGQKDDIIAELSDEIRSQIEEKESKLGRLLNEAELEILLREYGDPVIVAARYRSKHHTLAFGRVLIGPEVFPLYIGLLLFNAAITIIWIVYGLIKGAELNFGSLLFSAGLQFVCVTFAAIIIDYIRRKFPRNWLFPPYAITPLIEIPHWQSVSGIIVWSLFSLWWLLIQFFPVLLFGSAAANLCFTPAWSSFQVPVFVLLLLGLAQRLVNLFRPGWTWLPPFSRFILNTLGLIIIYFMVKEYPFINLMDRSLDPVHYEYLAGIFNAIIMWGFLVTWLWIFFLINAIVNAKMCIHHIARFIHNKSN